MGVGGGAGIGFSHFKEFESSLVQDFELFQKFCRIHHFRVAQSLLRD